MNSQHTLKILVLAQSMAQEFDYVPSKEKLLENSGELLMHLSVDSVNVLDVLEASDEYSGHSSSALMSKMATLTQKKL